MRRPNPLTRNLVLCIVLTLSLISILQPSSMADGQPPEPPVSINGQEPDSTSVQDSLAGPDVSAEGDISLLSWLSLLLLTL